MNRICEIMNWTAPAAFKKLIISIDGKDIAELDGARPGTYEGVYLIETGYGVPNACFSAMPGMTDDQIKRGLAKKLFANARNLKAGEIVGLVERLDQVTARAKPERS